MYYNELLLKPNGWIRVTKNCAAFMTELPELAAILDEQITTTPKQDSTPSGHSAGVEKDKKGRVIDRTPPTDGKNSRKKEDGYNEYWCDKCIKGGRWGNHSSDRHEAWVQKWKDRKNNSSSDSSVSSQSQARSQSGAPSMHGGANVCQTIFSSIRTAFNSPYDSDQSF